MPSHAYAYTKFQPLLTKPWDIVRNYTQFVMYIEKNGLPKLVSFDHDLDDEQMYACINGVEYKGKEKTGLDCAKFLIKYCMEKF